MAWVEAAGGGGAPVAAGTDPTGGGGGSAAGDAVDAAPLGAGVLEPHLKGRKEVTNKVTTTNATVLKKATKLILTLLMPEKLLENN